MFIAHVRSGQGYFKWLLSLTVFFHKVLSIKSGSFLENIFFIVFLQESRILPILPGAMLSNSFNLSGSNKLKFHWIYVRDVASLTSAWKPSLSIEASIELFYFILYPFRTMEYVSFSLYMYLCQKLYFCTKRVSKIIVLPKEM